MRPSFIHLSFCLFKEEEGDCEESIAESFEEALKKKTLKEMLKKDKMLNTMSLKKTLKRDNKTPKRERKTWKRELKTLRRRRV